MVLNRRNFMTRTRTKKNCIGFFYTRLIQTYSLRRVSNPNTLYGITKTMQKNIATIVKR
jgi:hypothetical protein